jgi:hypothetical protein
MGALTALGGYWARSAIARIAETRKMAGAISAIQESIKKTSPATQFLLEAAEMGVYGAADTTLNGLAGSAAALLNPFDLVRHGLNEGWQHNMKAAKARLSSVPGEAWHAFATGALQHSLSRGASKVSEKARKKMKLPEKAHAPPAAVPEGKKGDVKRFEAAASPKGKEARTQALTMMRGNMEQAPLQALIEVMTSEETYRSGGNIGDRYLEHLGQGMSQGIKDTWMSHHRERLLATRRVRRADEMLTKRGLKPAEETGSAGSPYRTSPNEGGGGGRMTPAEHESYMTHALRGQRNAEALPGRAEDLAVADPQIWLGMHRRDVAGRHDKVITSVKESIAKARKEGRKDAVEEHIDAHAAQEYQALVQARHGEPGVSFEAFLGAIHETYRKQKQDRVDERARDAEKALEKTNLPDAEKDAYRAHVRNDDDVDFDHWSGGSGAKDPEAWSIDHRQDVADRVGKVIADAEERAKKARAEGGTEEASFDQIARDAFKALSRARHGQPGIDFDSFKAYMKSRGARHAERNEQERRLAHSLAPGSVEALVTRGEKALAAAGIKGTVEIYVTGGGTVREGKRPALTELTFGSGDTLGVVVVVKPDPGAPKPTREQMERVSREMSEAVVEGRKHAEKPRDVTPGDRFLSVPVKARAVEEHEFYAETTKKGAPTEPLTPGGGEAPRAPFRVEGVSAAFRPPAETAEGHGARSPLDIYEKHGPLRTPDDALKALVDVRSWAIKAAYKNDPASAQAIVDAREQWVDGVLKALGDKYGVDLRAVGSTSLTSDYDLQLLARRLGAAAEAGGDPRHNVAKVLAEFNARARDFFGAESATALDTNVYDFGEAMLRASGDAPDFKSDNPMYRNENERLQDIMSLAKVRRYIGPEVQERKLSREEAQKQSKEAWEKYIEAELALTPKEMRREIEARMREAEKRYEAAEKTIDANVEKLVAERGENGARTEDAANLRLEAANELYVAALAKVDALRAKRDKALDALAKNPDDARRREAVDQYTLLIRQEMAAAVLFANEVYNSEGAVIHIVGEQAGLGVKAKKTELVQSLREQFADALKDLSPNHYGSDPDRAAVQTSKYLGRFLDGLERLGIAELIGSANERIEPARAAELSRMLAALEVLRGFEKMRKDPTSFDPDAIARALGRDKATPLVGPDGKLDVAALRRILTDLTQTATALARSYGPDGPGQFILKNPTGSLSRDAAFIGRLVELGGDAPGDTAAMLERVGPEGVAKAAGYLKGNSKAKQFVAMHGEEGLRALIHAEGDLDAARATLVPARAHESAGTKQDADSGAQGFVDLHNHWRGSLRPEYFVKEVWEGKSVDAFKFLVENVRKGYDDQIVKAVKRALGEDTPLPTDPKALAELVANHPEAQEIAHRVLNDLLVSEPGRTTFDAVFAVRGALLKGRSPEAIFDAVITQLKKEGVKHIEFSGYPDIPLDVARARAAAEGIEVRFLETIPTSILQKKLSPKEPSRKSRQEHDTRSKKYLDELTEAVLKPRQEQDQAAELTDKERAELGEIAKQAANLPAEMVPAVLRLVTKGFLGVDINGPEGAMQTSRKEQVKALYQLLGMIARFRNERVVFRPHVGEGYDGPDPSANHADIARQNIEFMLEVLRAVDHGGSNGDVVVRFGHATHASPAQMAEMQRLGIFVEILLSSNLSTGSLPAPSPDVNAIKYLASEHPLLLMLHHGVNVVVGTDGQGVYKTSMTNELETVAAIVRMYRRGKLENLPEGLVPFEQLPEEEKKRFSAKHVREYAEKYLQMIGQPTRPPGEA